MSLNRTRILLMSLFAFYSIAIVTTYYNPLLMRANHHWTMLILESHERFMNGLLAGSQQQRLIIPNIAQGFSLFYESNPIIPRIFRLFLGREIEAQPLLLAYVTLNFAFVLATLLAVYAFFRRALLIDIIYSLFFVTVFAIYECFALTAFVTGRWTDTSAPGLFILACLFLVRQRWAWYFFTVTLFSLIRENVIFVPVFGLLYASYGGGTLKKLHLRRIGASCVLILVIRLVVAKLCPGVGYTDNAPGFWESFLIGISTNLHDINALKMPLLMYNIFLVLPWLQWRSKTAVSRALALTGVAMYVVNMCWGSVGESYGRDLPALICFIASSASLVKLWLAEEDSVNAQAVL